MDACLYESNYSESSGSSTSSSSSSSTSATCFDLLSVDELDNRLQSPQELVSTKFHRQEKPGFIQGSTATFGAPFYGMRVIGRIMYGASQKGEDFCTPEDYTIPSSTGDSAGNGNANVNGAVTTTNNGNGALEPTSAIGGENGEDSDRREINIVLIKRGESKCRFTTKVQIAQDHHNAHAVIIQDKEKNVNRDVTKLIMADENNYGGNIKIPSILINYEDGEKLIQKIEAGSNSKPVIAELVWDIPVNNIVTMDLWMSAASREANDFLKGFKAAGESLAYNLKVVPHYHIFSVPSGQDYEKMCTDSSGQFCSEDPDAGGPVTGRDVVMESLRQLCIYEQTAVPDPEHHKSGERQRSWKWWEYVTDYLEQCPVHSVDAVKRFGNVQCSEALMVLKGIDVAAVNKCMLDTKEEKLKEQKKNTAWSKYAVRINGWRFAGAIEPDGITRAICAAYVDPVKECDSLIVAHSSLANIDVLNSGGGISLCTFFVLLLVIVVSLLLGMVIYKRLFFQKYIQKALREEVMLEVQNQLADYVPLEEPMGSRNGARGGSGNKWQMDPLQGVQNTSHPI